MTGGGEEVEKQNEVGEKVVLDSSFEGRLAKTARQRHIQGPRGEKGRKPSIRFDRFGAPGKPHPVPGTGPAAAKLLPLSVNLNAHSMNLSGGKKGEANVWRVLL